MRKLRAGGLEREQLLHVPPALPAVKTTVMACPLRLAAIWLPSVLPGLVAAGRFPRLEPGGSDDMILPSLTANTSVAVAGLLNAAFMACVMATDSRILTLGTMFTKDLASCCAGAVGQGRRLAAGTVTRAHA